MSHPARSPLTATVAPVLFAVSLFAVSGTVRAEVPGADWLTPAQTKQALKSAGYSEITKLEADDGHWDGEGIKDGRRMRFDADPKTGAILGKFRSSNPPRIRRPSSRDVRRLNLQDRARRR